MAKPPVMTSPQAARRPVVAWVLLSTAILFAASSTRHALFWSGAFDLGYFDQALYLISRGLPPVVSFWGYHFMGGHADWILYPIAALYWLYADVHWLFAIQAIALAIAALPVYHLSLQAGLKASWARVMVLAYLLYPLVFNINLFDFHPEVMATPLFFTAVWAARSDRVGWFTLCTVLILGCRDALSLSVAAMGFWLLVFERKRLCGAIALGAGTAWFLLATQVVIPMFRPAGVESVSRYAYLGDSVLDIALNLVLRPDLVLGRVFSLGTLEYLLLVFVPVLWGLSWRHLLPLVPALPKFVINILSDAPAQRDLVHQYSLPILPFLILAMISALAAQQTWVNRQRIAVIWATVSFLVLAKFGHFWTLYVRYLDNWGATQAAVAQLQPTTGGVLTNSNLGPHLTHRQILHITNVYAPTTDFSPYQYVLLNVRHPAWLSTPDYMAQLREQLQADPNFVLQAQRQEVYLFARTAPPLD